MAPPIQAGVKVEAQANQNNKVENKKFTKLEQVKNKLNSVTKKDILVTAGIITTFAVGVLAITLGSFALMGVAVGMSALTTGYMFKDKAVTAYKDYTSAENTAKRTVANLQKQNKTIASGLNKEKNDQGLNYTRKLETTARNILDIQEAANEAKVEFDLEAEFENVISNLPKEGLTRKPGHRRTFAEIVRGDLERAVGNVKSEKKNIEEKKKLEIAEVAKSNRELIRANIAGYKADILLRKQDIIRCNNMIRKLNPAYAKVSNDITKTPLAVKEVMSKDALARLTEKEGELQNIKIDAARSIAFGIDLELAAIAVCEQQIVDLEKIIYDASTPAERVLYSLEKQSKNTHPANSGELLSKNKDEIKEAIFYLESNLEELDAEIIKTDSEEKRTQLNQEITKEELELNQLKQYVRVIDRNKI